MRLRRLEEARDLYERVAKIYRDNFAADNHHLAMPLLSLSGVHLQMGDAAAAEETARQALEIFARTLPEEHFVRAIARCRLARSLVGQGRQTEAAPYFERSIEALIASDQYPEYRTECLVAAADFYEGQGDTAQATELRASLDVISAGSD